MDFYEKKEYTFEDIQTLIDNGAEENVHLDFKAAGSLDTADKKKHEIAKDVSAFANSDGGVIIYGINEEHNKASSFSFVDGNVYTKEWLEQVIQDNIQRHIEDLHIYPIRKDGDIKQTIYVVKIPRSCNTPHMSADKCYYKRNNFRSVKMEEYEVRDLFYRENTPKLRIWGYLLKQEASNEEYIIYTFQAQICNDGNTLAELCKLNCNLINIPNDINLSWDRKYNIDTTNVDSTVMQIYEVNTRPLFPTEKIELLRFKLKVPSNLVFNFIENTRIELVLFYSNKQDQYTFTVKEELIRQKRKADKNNN